MTSRTTTPTNEKHKTLLGKDPTPTQCRLYANFPEFRGFSDRALDPEKLEAVLVLGLTFGTVRDRVLVLAPVVHEDWVMAQFNSVCDRVFEVCKREKHRAHIAKVYGLMFQKLVVMGRLLQLVDEPSHWLSFGFSVDEELPAWMGSHLLVGSSSSK
jgi:hypothetical protein